MVTVQSAIIPNLDKIGNVIFKDGDVACGVEELVIRRARALGWYGMALLLLDNLMANRY